MTASQTVRAKAIRALLRASEPPHSAFLKERDMANVLTDEDGKPALAVYQIVDIVIDSVADSMKEER